MKALSVDHDGTMGCVDAYIVAAAVLVRMAPGRALSGYRTMNFELTPLRGRARGLGPTGSMPPRPLSLRVLDR
jgi:hypothetical protein